MGVCEEWNAEVIDQVKRQNEILAVVLMLSMIVNAVLVTILAADS